MFHSKKLHIAMFPWLAFGHIIPYLHLSKTIAQKGHRVSFLSPTRNIHRLPTHLHPSISFIKLNLPRLPELPQHAESTMDVPSEAIPLLKKAFDGLQPEIAVFLETESPDWIIYDFAPFWLPPLAAEHGVSRAYFSIVNGWFMGFVGGSPDDLISGSHGRKTVEDFMAPPEWVDFPTKVSYRKHKAKWILECSSVNDSGVSDLYRVGMILKGSDCVFIRDCYELEPQWLTLLEKLHRLPVVPVGLMPPSTTAVAGDEKDNTWVTIKNWLDGQRKGEVVYVALGSDVVVSQTELAELALGLELAGLPFFWALRKPPGCTDPDPIKLPDGFLERTHERGVVWTSWVTQLEILSHESIGGFLTHCGWGSIVEGLMCGHPLIMLPFLVDQGLNARVMVEKQVGIEVSRNEEDGSFTRDSVANSVSRVVVGDEGKFFKAKAMELRGVFADTKLHDKYVENL